MMRLLWVLWIAFPLVACAAEPRAKRKRMIRTADLDGSVTGSLTFTPERPQDPGSRAYKNEGDRHGGGDRDVLDRDVGPYAPPFAGRNLTRFPYGDGSTYTGTRYLSDGYHDFHTPDGFIGKGALHYGSGYSSNRINW